MAHVYVCVGLDKLKCAISIICLAVVLVLVLEGQVLVLGSQVLVNIPEFFLPKNPSAPK